jgi:glycogen debranching enzyme
VSDRAASSDGGLRAACLGTLARCDRGTYTVPSPLTYPHQWNWDSAFAALGWLCVDPRRAWQELETLTGAQARDGLVPHIAYASPRPLERLAPLLHRIPSLARFLPALVRSRYSPSPGWWGWLRGRDGRLRTAITQPPVAATAARLLFESTGDELAARRLLAPLSRWHAFLLGARDPCGLGEPVLIHPWESGRDNAVEWDAPLARIRPAVRVVPRPDRRYVDAAERPSDDHYRRFMTLVREGTRRGWPQRELAASGPFRVLDPAFSAILARAAADLAWLCSELGETRLAEAEAERGERVGAALRARLGSDGLLRAVDLVTEEETDALSCASALAAVAPDLPDRAVAAVAKLVTAGALASPVGVRSLARDDPRNEPRRYWRGPVWVNVTWLCAFALSEHGFRSEAELLRLRLVECVRDGGIREYFVPASGRGLGARDFAWTAALALSTLAGR